MILRLIHFGIIFYFVRDVSPLLYWYTQTFFFSLFHNKHVLEYGSSYFFFRSYSYLIFFVIVFLVNYFGTLYIFKKVKKSYYILKIKE
ncbi:MAG: hypothetical protein RLZZ502_845 [Pseudomonadota bacterium]